MTLEELKKKANKLLRECERCCEDDCEITIDGNGYNAHEAIGGIRHLVNLIDSLTLSGGTRRISEN
jgi:hypothetical protein